MNNKKRKAPVPTHRGKKLFRELLVSTLFAKEIDIDFLRSFRGGEVLWAQLGSFDHGSHNFG